ncbi:MAG: ribonuclease P protein component [Phycisphaerales bacterium]|nr:ribonuclease P protein component [Phycisphaerales bacterium]
MTGPGPDRLLFRRRHRLTRATEYQAAYCEGWRKSAGPITIYARPNGLGEHRLGLSVGRRVGGAVVRNRIKRLLREAFRLERAGFPTPGGQSFDVVIQVRPHGALGLVDYREILSRLVGRAVESIGRQGERDGGA